MKVHTQMLIGLFGVVYVFFIEYFRIRQPEAVYRLLHVADHKTVVISVLIPGYRMKYALLHQVAVLIFIGHDISEMFRQLPCFGRSYVTSVFRPVIEDRKGKVLQIRKIQHCLFPLYAFEPSGELFSQITDHMRVFRAHAQLAPVLFAFGIPLYGLIAVSLPCHGIPFIRPGRRAGCFKNGCYHILQT